MERREKPLWVSPGSLVGGGSLLANILRAVDRVIHKFLLYVSNVALVAMVVILTYTVVLRYVFNAGVAWAEEVPRLLVTVFVFFASAMGVRDRVHISVSAVFNLFTKNGRVQKFLVFLGDLVVLVCGAFMLYYGGVRVLRMMGLSGVQPMTGLPNWVQYAAVPVAGFVIVYDSLLFLFGVIKPGDLMHAEPEVDYVEQVAQNRNVTEGREP